MAKIFYDHLLFMEEIIAVIKTHKLTAKEKQKILSLIDSAMHNHMLNEILTHLPKHYHETFLHHFSKAPNDKKLLEFLKKEAREDIEIVLAKRASKVKEELLKDLKNK